MVELLRADNKIFSHQMDVDSIFPYRLRVDGYNLFNDLYSKSKENNLFKTPANFLEPSSGPGYQFVAFLDTDYKEYICNLINSKVDSELEIKESWYLYQTNDAWVNNPVHTHMTADWIAVTYLDVKPGDAIEFHDKNNNVETYEPKFGEILFFPGSTMHKPAPNISQKRLSLNIELGRKIISEQERSITIHRVSTCKGCDKFNEVTSFCTEDNSYIPVKVTQMTSSCPINKW